MSAKIRPPVSPSLEAQELDLWGYDFRGYFAFTCVTARSLAHHPFDGFVHGLQSIRFPSCLPCKLQGLAFSLAGLAPAEPSDFSDTRTSVIPCCHLDVNHYDGEA